MDSGIRRSYRRLGRLDLGFELLLLGLESLTLFNKRCLLRLQLSKLLWVIASSCNRRIQRLDLLVVLRQSFGCLFGLELRFGKLGNSCLPIFHGTRHDHRLLNTLHDHDHQSFETLPFQLQRLLLLREFCKATRVALHRRDQHGDALDANDNHRNGGFDLLLATRFAQVHGSRRLGRLDKSSLGGSNLSYKLLLLDFKPFAFLFQGRLLRLQFC